MNEVEEMNECFKLLKHYRWHINKQQYLTFRGQIKAKDFQGFRTGMFNLMKRKMLTQKR